MLKTIKWKQYKTIGNLELSFRKSDGSAYSTIILAGENGTGKTTILETIGRFLNGYSMEPFDYLEYDVNGKDYHIEPLEQQAYIGFHNRRRQSELETVLVRTARNTNFDQLQKDTMDVRYYGCVYSAAKSKFETSPIKSVTTQHIDDSKYEFDDRNDFTAIKQLIVDLDAQDDKAYRRENRLRGDKPLSETDFDKSSKLYRFKKAFNNFFETIEFDRIDDETEKEQRIIFKKHGHDISIDDLSTGEKQIVFRGAYLLRNSTNVDGGVVLIDEPELSMHPKWQEKILSYYKDLFTRDNVQKVQIVMATHSEYVIRKALEDQNDTLVFILEDKDGVIYGRTSRTPYVLPQITVAEVNFQAFHIYSIDYHIQLYGYLQRLVGNEKIEDMDSYIKNMDGYDSACNKTAERNGNRIEESLPTYIRNAIDHPDNESRNFDVNDLKKSTDILIAQIQLLKGCR